MKMKKGKNFFEKYFPNVLVFYFCPLDLLGEFNYSVLFVCSGGEGGYRFLVVPQTVLALRGSGGIKGW